MAQGSKGLSSVTVWLNIWDKKKYIYIIHQKKAPSTIGNLLWEWFVYNQILHKDTLFKIIIIMRYQYYWKNEGLWTQDAYTDLTKEYNEKKLGSKRKSV